MYIGGTRHTSRDVALRHRYVGTAHEDTNWRPGAAALRGHKRHRNPTDTGWRMGATPGDTPE